MLNGGGARKGGKGGDKNALRKKVAPFLAFTVSLWQFTILPQNRTESDWKTKGVYQEIVTETKSVPNCCRLSEPKQTQYSR